MIVVRVELWPGGSPRNIQNLGVMTIVNETPHGEVVPENSLYTASVDGQPLGQPFLHERSKGYWTLTFKALREYFIRRFDEND